MSEYIEREKALDAVVAWAEICPSTAISEIECMTAADVVPVVRGEWFDKGSLSCRCSECGCKSNKEYTYCPNCGAKMDAKSMTTLKPCPFCGNRVALIDNCHELEDCENFERCEATGYYAVVCSVNEGGCGASGGYARTEQEAVAKWNRRADVAPVVHGEWILVGTNEHDYETSVEEKCSLCGRYVYRYDTEPQDNYCPNCGAKMDKEAQDERND